MDLRCTVCSAVGLKDEGTAWVCPACPARFPLVGQIPRFVAREHYTESFGFQWNRFAGCGMGRFAEVCADAGAEVHAVDLSLAVDAAFRNLGHRPNVRIYQADIMHLPFPEGTFDAIYSIGVLHHTPDTRAAFLRLAPLLKPGGVIAIWVYSTQLRWFIGSAILRTITPRLAKSWLFKASRIAIPLYHVHRIPGGRHGLVDPPADWYGPRYQWKHTDAEVEGWFREAGLTAVKRGTVPVSIRGVRPAAAR